MNQEQLIREAADEKHPFPYGDAEAMATIDFKHFEYETYIEEVTHFIQLAKQRGLELVNIEDRTVQNLMAELKYPTCNSYDIQTKLAEAIAIGENRGAARERERMTTSPQRVS